MSFAPMNLWQAILLARKQGEISDLSLLLIKSLQCGNAYCKVLTWVLERHSFPVLTLDSFHNSN